MYFWTSTNTTTFTVPSWTGFRLITTSRILEAEILETPCVAFLRKLWPMALWEDSTKLALKENLYFQKASLNASSVSRLSKIIIIKLWHYAVVSQKCVSGCVRNFQRDKEISVQRGKVTFTTTVDQEARYQIDVYITNSKTREEKRRKQLTQWTLLSCKVLSNPNSHPTTNTSLNRSTWYITICYVFCTCYVSLLLLYSI